jgi:hypothetical protein
MTTILATDLGKYKSMVRVYDKKSGGSWYADASTNVEHFRSIIAQDDHLVPRRPVKFGPM